MGELAFEALASALYNMPFVRFLGERPDPIDGTNVGWFLLEASPRPVREDPRKVRVAIRRHPQLEGVVEVRAEWPNVSGGEIVMGSVTFHIPTLLRDRPVVVQATEDVMVRLLSIYQDVLSGEGVAGRIEDVMPDSAAADYEDPEEDPSDVVVPEGTVE
jgi:hypothetical protein